MMKVLWSIHEIGLIEAMTEYIIIKRIITSFPNDYESLHPLPAVNDTKRKNIGQKIVFLVDHKSKNICDSEKRSSS